MFLIHVYNRSTRDYEFTIYEPDGTTEITLADTDVVRVKIGSNGETPGLDLSSIAATNAGSVVDFTAGTGDCTLRIGQDDLATLLGDLESGAFDMEVLVGDDSESAPPNATKHAESGVLFVHPSQRGQFGVEESSSSGESSQSSASSESSS